MALLLEKPTVCKDCQSLCPSRARSRPFWLKLVTSNKRLYRCDICGWTVWVQRTAASSSTPDPLTEFPETVLQSTRHYTRPFVAEPPAPSTPPAVEPNVQASSSQPLSQAPHAAAVPAAQRHGQGELSFDNE